jgi:hypothetical protein
MHQMGSRRASRLDRLARHCEYDAVPGSAADTSTQAPEGAPVGRVTENRSLSGTSHPRRCEVHSTNKRGLCPIEVRQVKRFEEEVLAHRRVFTWTVTGQLRGTSRRTEQRRGDRQSLRAALV